MPRKVIILNNCSACPYKYYNKNHQRVCRYSDGKVIDIAVTTIPAWCELEDYAETEEATDQKTEESKV